MGFIVSNGKKPPLVEAIFEIRWGTPIRDKGVVEFKFDEEDSTLFAGVFRSIAQSDFPVYKKVNEGVPPIVPHFVKHQFWTGKDVWPCLQAGLGIVTANQVEAGYSWSRFRATCVKALEFLDRAHHQGLGGLPAIGVELRYQDAFELTDGESDSKFVENRAQVIVKTPDAFLKSPFLDPVIEDHHINFTVPVRKPPGILVNQLDRGLAGGRAAFIATTTLRSADAQRPEFSLSALADWLDQAHEIQRHAYETLIRPTNERAP
ncbi:MAG: TIGR04255 family protein [Steroidobacteraceae bacterium]